MKSESNEHMNVTVKGQDGGVVHFKIKRNTPLRKLMNAYCERSVSQIVNLSAEITICVKVRTGVYCRNPLNIKCYQCEEDGPVCMGNYFSS